MSDDRPIKIPDEYLVTVTMSHMLGNGEHGSSSSTTKMTKEEVQKVFATIPFVPHQGTHSWKELYDKCGQYERFLDELIKDCRENCLTVDLYWHIQEAEKLLKSAVHPADK